ncbi:hypothetical protein A4X09_0g494 [Tilletia walkeri]|uniref:RGS domain-containing protein n=1 Tax=Tilletia walkeri TaxID=117179 RepID=A0A8X7NEZ7_9BASI|nr:hypothetical protein A4X09_0g494 [Tilletia walkeri]
MTARFDANAPSSFARPLTPPSINGSRGIASPPPDMPLPSTPTPSTRKSSRSNLKDRAISMTSPRSTVMTFQRSRDSFGNELGVAASRRGTDSNIPREEDEHTSSFEDYDDDDQDGFLDDETERQPHTRPDLHRLATSEVPHGFPAPPTRAPSALNSAAMDSRNFVPSRLRQNGSSQTHTSLTPRDSARNSRKQRHEPQEYSYLEDGRDPMASERRSRPPSVNSTASSAAADFYRRTYAKTDLNFWEPSSRVANGSRVNHGPISNLPDWASLRGTDLTSHPVSHVQQDVEYSIMRLISPAVFEQFLSDPLGRHRFREYLNTFEDGANDLDFALDVQEHMRAFANLRQGSEAIHTVYVRDPENRVDLPSDLNAGLLTSLRATHALQHQLEGVHSHLVQTMFNSAFQRFIRASITEYSRVRLGALATNDNGDGLGAAFVLTNPRLRDHPIVLVSPAFCELTGYPQEAILQRNCRFLQGPSTSPASVQRIRDSLNTGSPSIELLLNYKRNGEPFWNLLCIIPLRDAKGRVQYFVGGQVNVTGALTTEGLSFLLGGGRSYENLPDPETTRLYGVEASPTLLKYYLSTDLPSDQKKGAKSDTSSLRHLNAHAAGSQLFYDNPRNTPTSDSASHGMNKNSSGGLMKRLWSRRQDTQLSQSLGRTAESEARRGAATIEEHMDDFAATYSRLALIKKDKREILFVTSSLLEYFDFPVSTPQQLYQSPLLHLDLLSLICGEDRNDTKRLRNEVQVAIRTGKTLKIAVSIRQPPRGLFGSSAVRKNAVLHVSPLRDVENNPSAAIVVFA